MAVNEPTLLVCERRLMSAPLPSMFSEAALMGAVSDTAPAAWIVTGPPVMPAITSGVTPFWNCTLPEPLEAENVPTLLTCVARAISLPVLKTLSEVAVIGADWESTPPARSTTAPPVRPVTL